MGPMTDDAWVFGLNNAVQDWRSAGALYLHINGVATLNMKKYERGSH